MKRLKKYRIRANQNGLASIVVVFVLVILVGVISLGFARLMSRALKTSVANQAATAAEYAAQSGINDVIKYIKDNPTEEITDCQPLRPPFDVEFSENTKYTCVLIDPTPTDLRYELPEINKSQVVRLNSSPDADKLLFTWQSPNRSHNQFADNGQTPELLDETTWAERNYAPMLRLTLYPVGSTGNPNDLGETQAESRTYFFYPTKPKPGDKVREIDYQAGSTRVPQPIECGVKDVGDFVGTPEYDCNVLISNLGFPAADHFYARLTPIYDQIILKIKGNSAGDPVEFSEVQAIADVTARSGTAVKRLQARIDIDTRDSNISPRDDAIPEFALRSANTICKRLLVPSGLNYVIIDPESAPYCPFSLSTTPPPPPPPPGNDCPPNCPPPPPSCTIHDAWMGPWTDNEGGGGDGEFSFGWRMTCPDDNPNAGFYYIENYDFAGGRMWIGTEGGPQTGLNVANHRASYTETWKYCMGAEPWGTIGCTERSISHTAHPPPPPPPPPPGCKVPPCDPPPPGIPPPPPGGGPHMACWYDTGEHWSDGNCEQWQKNLGGFDAIHNP